MERLTRLLLASSALVLVASAADAADLGVQPVYKAVPASAPLTYDWRGFYVGANVGGINTKLDSSVLDIATGIPAGTASGSNSGIVGGGQVGYNFMITPNWLLGIEADISAATARVSATEFAPGAVVNYVRKDDVFGTVRGRVGYAAGNWLFYGTGGYAWSNQGVTRTQVAGVINGAIPGITENGSGTVGGWAAGGGIEWGITQNLSVRAEYLHYGFEKSQVTFPLAGRRFDDRSSKDSVRIGVNWRLNWGN